MSRAAFWTSVRLETFPEFASSPTLRILSATLFNQHQKFFVPRRTQQRRLNHAAPFHFAYFQNKLLQFPQDTRMNHRIGDHTFAAISLILSGFELRLD